MPTPQWKFLIEGGSTGQVFTKISGADGDYAWATPSPGATLTGSLGQIAVLDGTGNAAGSANLTWTAAAQRLDIQAKSGEISFQIRSSIGDTMWTVLDTAGSPTITFGDSAGDAQGAYFVLDDVGGLISLQNSISGDAFSLDMVNHKTTSNVKHEASGDITITDHAKGLVLKDAQGTPHYWRVQLTAGALTVTDIGPSLP